MVTFQNSRQSCLEKQGKIERVWQKSPNPATYFRVNIVEQLVFEIKRDLQIPSNFKFSNKNQNSGKN